jgi:acyl carrier protein
MTTSLNKYNNTFTELFSISEDDLRELTYQGIAAWDSIGHMQLISKIEDEFDVMFETNDIIDFSSYSKGIEILKKYNVEF